MSDIEKQVSRRIQHFMIENDFIDSSRPLMVGVSGGADSVCLLYVLSSLRDKLGLKLHVVHLNHQLRGAESDADADYVSRLAQELGIPVTIEERDVASYREERRCSMEEAAREVRYSFFTGTAQSIGADTIVLGHTADDQAETILLHLIRGTGLSGLRGMQSVSRWQIPNGIQLGLIRPLLEVSHDEAQAYCDANKLSPRQDSSNVSPKYLRNRIRFEIMPKLLEYNPNIRQAISRCAKTITDDIEHLDKEVSQLWDSVVEEAPNSISLNNRAFLTLPLPLQRHLLRAVLRRFAGTLRDIELVHIENLIEVMTKPAGKRLSLPYSLRFYGDYERSLITTEESAPCPFPPLDSEYRLNIPGETTFPGWRVRAKVAEGQSESNETGYKARFDLDVVGSELIVRSRRDGDRFQPLGMNESKKLQDFMVDARVPRAWRDRVPLVCSGGWIVWVVGWRIDHRARVINSTKRVLQLEFEGVED